MHRRSVVWCLAVILTNLEAAFGPLSAPMRAITRERQLERHLFRAWCGWLCYPQDFTSTAESEFVEALQLVEHELGQSAGPWCELEPAVTSVPLCLQSCATRPIVGSCRCAYLALLTRARPTGSASPSERRTSSSCRISNACAQSPSTRGAPSTGSAKRPHLSPTCVHPD